MVRRKSELSRGKIDRGWPHQVALPAVKVQGGIFYTMHFFCEGLSLCPRTKSFRRSDMDYVVFCFADSEHAKRFRARFGGESIDPEDQPRWGSDRGARA